MTIDLAIVGAGPAGLAAAVQARQHGLSVLLLDDGPSPGGRIWQATERRKPKDLDDQQAASAIAAFRNSGTDYRAESSVWAIEPAADSAMVFWSQGGTAQSVAASRVLLATGTTERPLPFPGWTLPGVMTVGAAQIALKTSGLVPQGDVWIAGQGPLVLLYAAQLLAAGGSIAGILDIAEPGAKWAALSHLGAILRSRTLLRRGRAWRRDIAKAGIKTQRIDSLRAEGTDALTHIAFRIGEAEHREPASTLLIHDGVIPSVQITRALGCIHDWDPAQHCWRPRVDEWGTSSVPTISVAGDGTGIAGWQAAMQEGRLAAIAIAAAIGKLDPAQRDLIARRYRRALTRARTIRPLLDAVFPPRTDTLADDTIVCRCEEITAGRIREAVSLGCLGLNQLKAFTRCGMGPCQSRMCAPTAARVIAQARGVRIEDIEPHRLRFPTKPLTLGELAALDVAP
jgi:NADPH-dependent 2,4-dienoyl-CoA reductase/sulfur reductase-like enzyme